MSDKCIVGDSDGSIYVVLQEWVNELPTEQIMQPEYSDADKIIINRPTDDSSQPIRQETIELRHWVHTEHDVSVWCAFDSVEYRWYLWSFEQAQ
jgi:hypothetical protein